MELTATAILPYDDAAAARSALRARLQDVVERRQLSEVVLEGATMLIAGPTVVADAAGRTWFEWVATLKIRPGTPTPHRSDRARPGPALPAPPCDEADARPTVNDLGLLRRRAG